MTTDLSQISGLFVIARNSTFVYKGKPVKIRQVAEELGVRYVLEGSVRKAGKQVRINTQLIDATTGHHIWAKRYDGKLDDIFALQDKITERIISALAGKLTSTEQELISHRDTDNIDAYDAFLQGWEHYLRLTEKDFVKAASYLKSAIELDPNYGRAHAALTLVYWKSVQYVWYPSLGVTRREGWLRAMHHLQVAMANPTSIAYQAASEISLFNRLWEKSIVEAKQAIDLDPNDANGYLVMGQALVYSGKSGVASEYIKKAMRLDPHNPARPLLLLGLHHFCAGKFNETVTMLERSSKYNPELIKGFWASPQALLAAAYGHLGRHEAAEAALGELMNWDVRVIMSRYFPFMYPKDAARLADGLIRVGVIASPHYYKIFKENQLNGEEIGALVFGRKVADKEGIIERSKGGEATFQRGILHGSDSGKSWIEDDMLCDQWQKRHGGQKICYAVFRNPEGELQMLDEYLYFKYFFVTRQFSPVD